MSDSLPTLVILATYNEIENLPLLVKQIFSIAPAVEILVVDDNSPDGTGRWCRDHAEVEPRFHVHHREGKLGLGSATVAGFRFALQHGYARVATMDADFSHSPTTLPALLSETEKAEVVIGSRYCPGGKIEGWPLTRRVCSRTINLAARFLLNLPVRDCSGAFRRYDANLLRRIDLDSLRSSGYAYLEEILWLSKRSGATFAETPITFVDRVRGESKINWREAVGALRMLLGLAWRNLFTR